MLYFIGVGIVFGALAGLALLRAITAVATEHDRITAFCERLGLLPKVGVRI